MDKSEYNTIDEYIAFFSDEVKQKLIKIRIAIKKAAPEASEKISYGMPTFYLNGNLVHFAAYKKHIGFYPAPSGIEAFKERLEGYKTSKGAVQFPLERPVPYRLIEDIVAFRAAENLEK
jgi:uncharacterized protein YdhG (YjbR/CyaY superfamily)